MDGLLLSSHALIAIGIGRKGLSLRAIQEVRETGLVTVYCRGVNVGETILRAPLAPGDVIDVPITRLPRVVLPVELRVSMTIDGPDLAAPWRIETPEAAQSLLGPPDARIEDLHLDHGILRGTGREARNGLLEPVLYARINEARSRMVSVDPPTGLPEGGCAFRFALTIQAADMAASGLTIQLFMIGQDAPIGSFAWTEQAAGAAERRITSLEARLQQMEHDAAAAQHNMHAAVRGQLAVQQERIDAFIAAASTLLLDRLAVEPGREQDALRGLLETAGPGLGEPEGLDLTASRVEVAPDAGVFGTGWHREEVYPSGSFRWMSQRGMVLNPAPERPLAGVTLEICHLYRAAAPAMSALFDEAAAQVEISEQGHGAFSVRITPVAAAVSARLVRLSSLTGGRPADDEASTDRRLLSFAVSRLWFEYAD